jgi:hypothetical protein
MRSTVPVVIRTGTKELLLHIQPPRVSMAVVKVKNEFELGLRNCLTESPKTTRDVTACEPLPGIFTGDAADYWGTLY